MPKLLAAAITLFLLAAPARAHVFLEPDVGFEAGSSSQDFQYTNAPESKSSYSHNGSTIGAALGYRHDWVYGAAQYERGMGGHLTDISALVGANFAVRARIWLGYIISAKDDVSKGSGFKAGVGFSISRIFRLNLEYASRSYNQYTDSTASTLTYSGKTTSFKATLSIPFQL